MVHSFFYEPMNVYDLLETNVVEEIVFSKTLGLTCSPGSMRSRFLSFWRSHPGDRNSPWVFEEDEGVARGRVLEEPNSIMPTRPSSSIKKMLIIKDSLTKRKEGCERVSL